MLRNLYINCFWFSYIFLSWAALRLTQNGCSWTERRVSVSHHSLISPCQKCKNCNESMKYYISPFFCRWRTVRKICRSYTCCYFVCTFSCSFGGCSICFCKVRFMYPCHTMFASTQKYFKEKLKQSYKWSQSVISKCIAFSFFFFLLCRNLARDSQRL